MKLSTRGRYALRMMIDIARNGSTNDPVPLAGVAGRTGISRGYLEQVASVLRNARLLRSVAGRYGGYRLARPEAEITVGEIVEAAIGPVCVVDCLDRLDDCPRSESCECRVVYGLINDRIADVLREFTLANLVDPNWVRDQNDTGKKSC